MTRLSIIVQPQRLYGLAPPPPPPPCSHAICMIISHPGVDRDQYWQHSEINPSPVCILSEYPHSIFKRTFWRRKKNISNFKIDVRNSTEAAASKTLIRMESIVVERIICKWLFAQHSKLVSFIIPLIYFLCRVLKFYGNKHKLRVYLAVTKFTVSGF